MAEQFEYESRLGRFSNEILADDIDGVIKGYVGVVADSMQFVTGLLKENPARTFQITAGFIVEHSLNPTDVAEYFGRIPMPGIQWPASVICGLMRRHLSTLIQDCNEEVGETIESHILVGASDEGELFTYPPRLYLYEFIERSAEESKKSQLAA